MTDMGARTVTTGIAGLDTVLHGGYPAGRLHLVQGSTGTGKTTLALHFALAGVARGEPVAYVSLAETEAEITAVAASHHWSVDGLSLYYQGPAARDAPVQTVLQPAEVELPAVLQALLARVEALRPARLVIDSLTELRILAREPRWFRHELMRLRERLEALGCTALLLDTEETLQGAESLLGGVIRLERTTPAYGPDRRRLQIVKMRGHAYASGYHDVRIRTGGLAVYPRLVAAGQRRAFPPAVLSTGEAALDAMLGGGLDRGTATLLLGPTGTGKSTVALMCAMAAAARGEHVLGYVFEERLQTLLARAHQLGFDLEGAVEREAITLVQVDPAELTPGEFAEHVRRSASERGTRLVLLDSLNGYFYSMLDEDLLHVHLHELFSYLSQQGISSVMVATQHGVLAATAAALDVSYLSDTVVLFRTVPHHGRYAKSVMVHKRRAGVHEAAPRELCLSAQGVRIGDVLPLADARPGLPSAPPDRTLG